MLKLGYRIIACILLTTHYGCVEEKVEPVCADLPTDFKPSETQALFLDLVFDQEFGQSAERLRKWNAPIQIFIEGSVTDKVQAEIDLVIAELNGLSTFIALSKVSTQEEANLRLFLGEKEDYVALVEPDAAGIAEGNNGFATIAWNNNFMITRASACIDVVNTTDSDRLKHIIREELAQCLGLINDTELDENSMFYQFSSSVANYSQTDQKIIAAMLGNDLKAGMCPNIALGSFK